MAELNAEHTFNGNIEKVLKGIKNFDEYVNHLPGVTSIKVLKPKEKGSICQVRYDISIIKSFHYILDMYEESPTKLWWEMAESNIMKLNSGSWELAEQGDKTHAKYSLELKFKGLVPSKVTDKVAKANLPAMFKGFQTIIDL